MSGILLVVCTAGLSILFVLQIRAFKAIQRWHRSLPEPFILPLTGLVLGVADALRWPSLHIISYRLLSLLYAVICLLYVTDGYHAGLLLVVPMSLVWYIARLLTRLKPDLQAERILLMD